MDENVTQKSIPELMQKLNGLVWACDSVELRSIMYKLVAILILQNEKIERLEQGIINLDVQIRGDTV